MNYEAVNIYKHLKNAAIQHQQQSSLKRSAAASSDHDAPQSPGDIGARSVIGTQSDSDDVSPTVETVRDVIGESVTDFVFFASSHPVSI